MHPSDLNRSLRPKQAAEFLGVGVSTLWRWVKEQPDFPQPVRLSERVTVFAQGDLISYRESRAQKAAA